MKNDQWIVEQLIKQNEIGLEALIDQYGGLLKSVIRKQLYSLSSHQEECLNDVLLAIWKNIKQYDPTRSNFKNWICAIARYRSINTLKKYSRELHSIEWKDHVEGTAYQDKPFAKELWEIQLDELLAPLSQQDRKLFKEVFDSSETTDDIAKKHNMTRGALYSRLSRGKEKIRVFFRSKGDQHDEK